MKNVTKRTVFYAVVSAIALVVSVYYGLQQNMFVASIWMIGAIIYAMNTKASIDLAKAGLTMEDYRDD